MRNIENYVVTLNLPDRHKNDKQIESKLENCSEPSLTLGFV